MSRALEDRPRAIAAFRRVRDLHGRSSQLFESLKELLTEEQDFKALAELYDDEVAHEAEPERRRGLYLELGAVHRHHTGELLRALEAFVVARDWERAIEVAGLHPADAGLGLSVVERLRELAVKAFEAEAQPEALAAADWAVQELCDRRLERGEYETVVSELLDAAKLPFSATRKRELRRDAACLCSDRLDDNQSAIHAVQRAAGGRAGRRGGAGFGHAAVAVAGRAGAARRDRRVVGGASQSAPRAR